MFDSGFRTSVTAVVLTAALSLVPVAANAARGDCSQPVTDGALPRSSDCLHILRAAVEAVTCSPQCICDPNSSSTITSSDALLCLRVAVESPGAVLDCGPGCGSTTTTIPSACETNAPVGCAATKLDTCTSADFVFVTGSDLDIGWNGLGHNQDLADGATISVDILRRCKDNPDTTCKVDSECPSGDVCRPFCDCDDLNNSICEITGPTHQRRCVKDLMACSTNADCGVSGRCEHFAGPPLPVSAANTPACITSYFQRDITGTADSETGAGEATAFLRSRVHLGVAQDRPCPACGLTGQNPQVGQQFTCMGGPKNGQSCTVEAVSPVFGGVSSDCPPDLGSNVSGEGLAVRFRQVTTGTTSRTAELPCLGTGFCTDDGSSCTTNSDCTRCTNDLSPCSANADCADGTCASAPDQPIACGMYCHCGFCNNDPSAPCFNNDDCASGQTCLTGDQATGEQNQPNGCTDLVCGRVSEEQCCNTSLDGAACPQEVSSALAGKCSIKPFLACAVNSDCSSQGGGVCVAGQLPCFGHKITRTGEPSPLGSYCVEDPAKGACSTNSDCTVGACIGDTSAPTTVALFCAPRITSDTTINEAVGIPGPGALTFKGVIYACRCGDQVKGCSEECDDGNNSNGDGCDQACRLEAQGASAHFP